MKTGNISKMVKGWFVGDFEPTLIKTNAFEVAVKYYKLGDFEGKHFHKIATELTVICSGEVLMNDKLYTKGDIIVLEPGEVTDFLARKNTICTVVKIPSVIGDKYTFEEAKC